MQKGTTNMFGKRFAYQYSGPGDEHWTPPWLRHRGPHPRFFGMHGGHRPFGPLQDTWGNDWTPPSPWLREEPRWRGPRFFAMHRGRGPFGPGGPFGHSRPFGPGG